MAHDRQRTVDAVWRIESAKIIARADLAPEATLAQRIVRAKRTLSEARVPFAVPRGDALAPHESEVRGLVALMEIQASRTRARTNTAGGRSCCWSRTEAAGLTC